MFVETRCGSGVRAALGHQAARGRFVFGPFVNWCFARYAEDYSHPLGMGEVDSWLVSGAFINRFFQPFVFSLSRRRRSKNSDISEHMALAFSPVLSIANGDYTKTCFGVAAVKVRASGEAAPVFRFFLSVPTRCFDKQTPTVPRNSLKSICG